jgi:O-antigen ligase
MAWHSLYLQVAVEAGLAGLGPVVVWLILALVRILFWTRRAGVIFPLTCFVGYMMITLTVSGQDTNAGVLVGIGLLGTVRIPIDRRVYSRPPRLPIRRQGTIASQQTRL